MSMKKLIVRKSKLEREVFVPSSKSQTHRAILFGSLAKGNSTIHFSLNSHDTLAMVEACRLLGAKITVRDQHMKIEGIGGKIHGAEDVINAFNSGIILRFVTAIAALGSQPIIITGDHSVRHQRPMHSLMNSLRQLGVQAISTRGNGFAPIIIQGPLKAGECLVEDGADSQNVSALLIAGVFAEGTLTLDVKNPGEKPWIDITLDWLKRLGVPYENHQYKKYTVQGIGIYPGFNYSVPGDWSSAAFPLAAAIITQSEIALLNLDPLDLQGDRKIIEIFKEMGAHLAINDKMKIIRIHPVDKLKGVTVDINDCIDALPIIAAVACFAEGETRLTNAAVARQKECDRIKCIAAELNKMGAHVQEMPDGLIIKGTSSLNGTTVLSHGDHRTAMALAVAGMRAKGETCINDTDCIRKTYPSFVRDLQTIGVNMEEIL